MPNVDILNRLLSPVVFVHLHDLTAAFVNCTDGISRRWANETSYKISPMIRGEGRRRVVKGMGIDIVKLSVAVPWMAESPRSCMLPWPWLPRKYAIEIQLLQRGSR